MAYEPKDNSGSLFKNDRREKDTHANARGSALIDGVEYYVDAWTNEDRNGNKYQSLKFKRKDGAARFGGNVDAPLVSRDQQHRQNLGNGGFAPAPDLDDEIPF